MIRRHSVLAALAIATVFLAGGTHTALAADKVCQLAIAGSDAMQFDKKELDVAADCTQVELTLTHSGKLPAAAMGHNWVLVKTADVTTVANAGMSAGLANNYLTPNDPRVIASTKTIGGGQSASVTFPTSKLTKGGDYTFMCTFPGHYVIMKGIFKFG
ncbi:MAG TPA: azurin [Steroidobacteraceae bacterium]|jgi:azurin|nr:azurin [Steroidobacteraceae bacterium]